MAEMSDLEKRIKEFEANERNKEQAKADAFAAKVAPALPIAILFCNQAGQSSADAEQIKGLFEGSYADKFLPADDAIDGFEFVNYLAEYTGENNDVVIVTNANEIGFDVIRIMQYFDQGYYITDMAQAKFLDKLGFVVEEQEYLEEYARQTTDKAWEIYDAVRDELTANGFAADEMNNAYEAIASINYKEDRLRVEIMRLIDGLKHA